MLRQPYQERAIQQIWTDRIESWGNSRKYVLTLSWELTHPLVEENIHEGILVPPTKLVHLPGGKTPPKIALGQKPSHETSKYSQYISSVVYTGFGNILQALFPGKSDYDEAYRDIITNIFGYFQLTV